MNPFFKCQGRHLQRSKRLVPVAPQKRTNVLQIYIKQRLHYFLEGDLYFSGGYNMKTHGSRYGGMIDAIQIESCK